MKKLYIVTLGLLMMGFAVMAQAPFKLTYENHAHQGDQDFNFVIGQNVNVEISQGSAQLWDFSNVANSPKNLTSHMLPTAKGLKSSAIPEANIIINENNNEFYFKLNRHKMEQYGTSACGNTIITYDQPILKLKFPFAYGESFSGDFSGKQVSANGHEMALKGRYNVGVVGYGTIILPTGQEVQNTLLLRTERIHVYGSSEQSTITYRWYAENVRYPIFVVIRAKSNNGPERTIQTAYHENVPMPEKSLSAEMLSNSDNLKAFPNPFAQYLNVTYRLDTECKVRIDLYDMSGKRVHQIIDNVIQCEGIYNVEITSDQVELPAGIYYVRAKLGKDSFEQKVVKSE